MSLASALFSDSQSRVFRWIFGHPERAFHLNELRRLTGLGSASLQRELNRLTDARLVRSDRIGNLRRFQANSDSPVAAELLSLTRKLLGVEHQLRDALLPLAPSLHGAWIYGSVAKRTDTAQSDIDLMLIGDDILLGHVLELLVPLETELGRKINPTCYTTTEFERRRSEPDSFVSRVLAQPIIPLIGDFHEPGRSG
jgi:predicted nucleotidyltransferase